MLDLRVRLTDPLLRRGERGVTTTRRGTAATNRTVGAELVTPLAYRGLWTARPTGSTAGAPGRLVSSV